MQMTATGHAISASAKLGRMPKREKKKKPAKTIPGLGERVRETYQGAGLNRNTAAIELHCSYSTINNWENETVVPDTTSLVPLARLGGVRLDWLVTGEGPRFVDDARNAQHNEEDLARREAYRKAVDEYVASPLAVGISPKTVGLLRQFDFSSIGISHPEVKDVHRIRDLVDMNLALSHLATDG